MDPRQIGLPKLFPLKFYQNYIKELSILFLLFLFYPWGGKIAGK